MKWLLKYIYTIFHQVNDPISKLKAVHSTYHRLIDRLFTWEEHSKNTCFFTWILWFLFTDGQSDPNLALADKTLPQQANTNTTLLPKSTSVNTTNKPSGRPTTTTTTTRTNKPSTRPTTTTTRTTMKRTTTTTTRRPTTTEKRKLFLDHFHEFRRPKNKWTLY